MLDRDPRTGTFTKAQWQGWPTWSIPTYEPKGQSVHEVCAHVDGGEEEEEEEEEYQMWHV